MSQPRKHVGFADLYDLPPAPTKPTPPEPHPAVIPQTIVPEITVISDNSEPLSQTTVIPQITVIPQTTARAAAGYTQIPNTVLDGLLPTLGAFEQIVYLRLVRLSYGFRSDRCKVGYEKLVKTCNLSRATVQRTIAKLEHLGHIERISTDGITGSFKDRGSVYRVILPEGTVIPQTTVRSQTTVIPGTTVIPQTPNKSSKKNDEKKAPAPPSSSPTPRAGTAQTTQRRDPGSGSGRDPNEPPMYQIRWAIVRLWEAHKRDPEYTRAQFVSEARTVLLASGMDYTQADFDEAVSGMKLYCERTDL